MTTTSTDRQAYICEAVRMGLVDELERRGARRGVAAVSGAAGLGVATLVELV